MVSGEGYSLLQGRSGETRTMWQAARDLVEDGTRKRCAETWQRGFRLWMRASASSAPGQPVTLTPLFREWMP